MTGNSKKPEESLHKRRISVVIFSLFFAWVLSFPFEGQVLYSLADKYAMAPEQLVFIAIVAHFAGLFSGGFFIRDAVSAKKTMIIATVICLLGSVVFFFPLVLILPPLIGFLTFIAGWVVASWGVYFKSGTPSGGRFKTAADVLIYSNILMILINAAAVLISAYVGLALSIVALMGVIFLAPKLEPGEDISVPAVKVPKSVTGNVRKPLIFLCLFITIITIDSGLMYEVINPAFEHLEALTSWYWAVPYIIVLIIMRNLPKTIKRTYVLFVGIAMIGLSFVFFMILDRSPSSYLVVNTLMLGACGIFDLFWWSILGEMLDLSRNSVKVFGIGLSANVLGVLLGGLVGYGIYSVDPHTHNPTIIALIVVFVVLMILPLLNKTLSRILSDHVYVTPVSDGMESDEDDRLNSVLAEYGLSGRENEIVLLLLNGRTYKMIAGELYLSENTIKTHLKNAYSKLGVGSKAALIQLLKDKS